MSMREYELRESRRLRLSALAFAMIAVLQGFAGRWWIVAFAALLALANAIIAGLASLVAHMAEPWQEAVIRRPRRWERWVAVVLTALCGLCTLGALWRREWLDAASWTLATFAMWLSVKQVREQLRLTEPPKTPVRIGPPEEWLP